MNGQIVRWSNGDRVYCQFEVCSRASFLTAWRLGLMLGQKEGLDKTAELIALISPAALQRGREVLRHLGICGEGHFRLAEIHHAVAVCHLVILRTRPSSLSTNDKHALLQVVFTLADACVCRTALETQPAPSRIKEFPRWTKVEQRIYRRLHEASKTDGCIEMSLAEACQIVLVVPRTSKRTKDLLRWLWHITATHRAALAALMDRSAN